jgi:hypothetical protein
MTVRSAQHQTDPAGKRTAEGDAAIWRAFAAPASDAQFCQAWLALLCRQLPDVTAGVLLMQSGEAATFLPVAAWPDVVRDLSFLGKVAERALVERRGVVDYPETDAGNSVHIAYPAEVGGRMVGAVVLDVSKRSEAEIQDLLRQLHWGTAWLRDLVHRRERAGLEGKGERVGTVMEVLATALRRGRLQQVLFDVANHISKQLGCSRVAIGLARDRTVKVATLSNAAWFEANAAVIKAYVAAMEETCDAQAPQSYRRPAPGEAVAVAVEEGAHARLARESGACSILSVPLMLGSECIGVLMLERDTDDGFDVPTRAWVDTVAVLLPGLIDQKRVAERGYLTRLGEDGRKLLERLFKPGYLIWKFSASLGVLCVLVLALVDVEYRVSAKTVVEGQVQRSAVAPFEGFVAASYVRAGDTVKQGQVLCLLDDRDLKLEQQRYQSEREQHSRKLREAMANHELAQVQILGAQLQQAEAQLALVEDRLRRVRITAPFDGVVISGDLSQLIGSPVELGKKLFDVAPLHAYRVILQVDERDMRHLALGQQGKLLISGVVGEPLPLQVSKITPVANAQDGRNFFRVEATLANMPAHLRPGMEGIGKVNTGQRGLWWIITHNFTDWLRLSLWTWLP